MEQRMDIDPAPIRVYPLLVNSLRIAAFCFTTDSDSYYGQADFNMLKPMWENFGCRVEFCKDPTIAEFWDFISKLKEKINTHGKCHDYLSLTFIGHGGRIERVIEGKTFAYEYFNLKDGYIRIAEVRSRFNTNSCYGLAGCPILVFVQACRGHEEEIPSELVSSAATISQGQDFYVLNSCVEGTVSFFDALSGESYFFRSLKGVFEADYEHNDLVQMGRDIRHLTQPKGYIQTIEATDTLTKEFRFNAETVESLPINRGIISRPTNPPPFPVGRASIGSASHAIQAELGVEINCKACNREFALDPVNEQPRKLPCGCNMCLDCIQDAIYEVGDRPCTNCGSTDTSPCDKCGKNMKLCDNCKLMAEIEGVPGPDPGDGCHELCCDIYEEDMPICAACKETFEADGPEDIPINFRLCHAIQNR